MVKKIKNISYPTKYKELLDEYGEEEGNIKYYKFIRGISLEKYILKYGEEEGNIKYKEYKNKLKTSGVSLIKMIKKYGEEEGNIKYNKWLSSTRQDLNGFIIRYGEEEGNIKYNIFKSKSLKALEKVDHKNKLSIRKLNYWLNKCDGNVVLAKQKLQEYQNKSSLDKYIEKYGEEEGKKLYIDNNAKKAITLEHMIQLYGETDGKVKYNKWKNSLKNHRDKYIKKYGIDKGNDLYNELIKKRTKRLNRYSNIGLEFCEAIYNQIKTEYSKIYFGDNEYMFYVFEDDIKIISPDLYIKDINLVIEFYGDFWHKNPMVYNKEQEFVLETWEKDEKRINKLKTKYNSYTIIIWEKEYKENKDKVIKNIIKQINNIKNGNN